MSPRSTFTVRFSDAAYQLVSEECRQARAVAREFRFDPPRSLTNAIRQARAYREAGVEVLYVYEQAWQRCGSIQGLGSMEEQVGPTRYFDLDRSELSSDERHLRDYHSRRAWLKTTAVRWGDGSTRRGKLLALQVEYRTLGLEV